MPDDVKDTHKPDQPPPTPVTPTDEPEPMPVDDPPAESAPRPPYVVDRRR